MKGLKWEAKDRKEYFYFFTSNLYPSNNDVDIPIRRDAESHC